MAKIIYIVSKTHLDLGFTELARVIRQKYIDSFFPKAIAAAKELNADGEKRFVWTTGSWIIKEALNSGSQEQRAALSEALINGDIRAHALPFTTHTELLDADTFRYGLSLVKDIDRLSGRRTVAAKMTDVPGHTAAIVPLLAESGIKLLHIGLNEASAVPEVPETFLWKFGEGEVVVIYSASYGGGLYSNPFIEEKLYFAHTGDNGGPASANQAAATYERLKKDYPDYKVVASGMDEIAERLWAVRGKLPVITSEIGDTWIHGSASDPYKSAALRELIAEKNQSLRDGVLERGSAEYLALADNILCLAEHTCGKDQKMFLSDYSHYLKKSFQKARQKDSIKLMPSDLRRSAYNRQTAEFRKSGEYREGSYRALEESWEEQRGYIQSAISRLSPERAARLNERFQALIPAAPPKISGEEIVFDRIYNFGDAEISVNSFGALSVMRDGKDIFKANGSAADYLSYSKSDFDYFEKNYMRDLDKTGVWSIPDFSYPDFAAVDGKYPVGRFPYRVLRSGIRRGNGEAAITLALGCQKNIAEELGAPRELYIEYQFSPGKIAVVVSFFGKDANRLPEALFFRLYPSADDGTIRFVKIGSEIDPYNVASRGGRNLSAVEKVKFSASESVITVINKHSPLVSLGKGKIIEFDNLFASADEGLSFVLHDNIWKTNFPLWYKGSAGYVFEIFL